MDTQLSRSSRDGSLGVDRMAALRTHHVHIVSSWSSCSILVGVVVTLWTGILVMIWVVGPVLGVIVYWCGACIKMSRSSVYIFFVICLTLFMRLAHPITSCPNRGGPLIGVCSVFNLTVRGVVIKRVCFVRQSLVEIFRLFLIVWGAHDDSMFA